MFKLIVSCLLLSFSLAVCADDSNEVADAQKQFFDIVFEQISVDGEELLCEQDAYPACFDTDKAGCITQQSTHKADCLEAFTANRSENPGTNHTFAFMQCMKTKHVEAAGGADSASGKCVDAAMKTFKSSPYSKRIEVVFALTVSDRQIAADLCDRETLFACLNDTPAICKLRVASVNEACMQTVKQAVLTAAEPMNEEQAARDYMTCLMAKNECE